MSPDAQIAVFLLALSLLGWLITPRLVRFQGRIAGVRDDDRWVRGRVLLGRAWSIILGVLGLFFAAKSVFHL